MRTYLTDILNAKFQFACENSLCRGAGFPLESGWYSEGDEQEVREHQSHCRLNCSGRNTVAAVCLPAEGKGQTLQPHRWAPLVSVLAPLAQTNN